METSPDTDNTQDSLGPEARIGTGTRGRSWPLTPSVARPDSSVTTHLIESFVKLKVSLQIYFRSQEHDHEYSLILQGSSISIGNWGCGAFGGNPRIKCLVQVLAASIAGVRKLDFYTFGEKGLAADFESALKMMKGQTVGWVWERIKVFRCKSGTSVLHYIAIQAKNNVIVEEN